MKPPECHILWRPVLSRCWFRNWNWRINMNIKVMLWNRQNVKFSGAPCWADADFGIGIGIEHKHKSSWSSARRAKRAGNFPGTFPSKYKGNTNEIRRAKRAGNFPGTFPLKYKGNTNKIRRAKHAEKTFGSRSYVPFPRLGHHAQNWIGICELT